MARVREICLLREKDAVEAKRISSPSLPFDYLRVGCRLIALTAEETRWRLEGFRADPLANSQDLPGY